MNVRLQKTWAWNSGIVYDGNYTINEYLATVHMTTVTDDHVQQNIAYERMKYWFDAVMTNAVFVNQESDLVDAYRVTGQRVMTLPNDPIDQIMGMMLYLKLNAITENRIVITDVELSSNEGDHMTYIHSVGETVGPFESEGWWLESGLAYTNVVKPRGKSKVVNLVRFPEWANVGLGWEENPEQTASTVVFADFPRNENK
jgi:hypothetical protein